MDGELLADVGKEKRKKESPWQDELILRKKYIQEFVDFFIRNEYKKKYIHFKVTLKIEEFS